MIAEPAIFTCSICGERSTDICAYCTKDACANRFAARSRKSVLIAQTGHRFLVHGHRGARAIYPENTIPAFVYAIESGADALEMDLAVTRDDVLVVSHDPHINPEICTGPHP